MPPDNTLSLEFVDELVQPEMDGDGARAECGAMRAVEHPVVGEYIARGVRSSDSRGGRGKPSEVRVWVVRLHGWSMV